MTRKNLTLANGFTLLRLLMIPVFGWHWAFGDHEVALYVFVGAALTDLLDGLLARVLNQRSPLGALLDPLADKLLVFVSLLAGLKIGAIPAWLAGAVIGRDVVLLVGVAAFSLKPAWRVRHGPEAWRPTRLGKYAMVLQSFTVISVIIDDLLAPAGFRPYVEVIMIATATLTVIAGVQYVMRAVWAIGPGPRAEVAP